MRTRIEAGTDIAMIGAWDAGRDGGEPAKLSGKKFMAALNADVEAGQLFFIETGADGGGPVDVFVDEEIPPKLRQQIQLNQKEFLLRIGSGQMMVGGVEDYRSGQPRITGPDSSVNIPAGDYALKCHVGAADGEGDGGLLSNAELEKVVGIEELRYYKRVIYRSALGYLLLLLFPALIPLLGWKLAIGITLVVLVAFLNVQERVLIKRDARYLRVKQAVQEAHAKRCVDEPPTFVLELRKLAQTDGMKGGSLDLH